MNTTATVPEKNVSKTNPAGFVHLRREGGYEVVRLLRRLIGLLTIVFVLMPLCVMGMCCYHNASGLLYRRALFILQCVLSMVVCLGDSKIWRDIEQTDYWRQLDKYLSKMGT